MIAITLSTPTLDREWTSARSCSYFHIFLYAFFNPPSIMSGPQVIDYANLPTPPACVADFCLIPVSILCLMLTTSTKKQNLIGCWWHRLAHLPPQYQMRWRQYRDWWRRVGWAILCTVLELLLVSRWHPLNFVSALCPPSKRSENTRNNEHRMYIGRWYLESHVFPFLAAAQSCFTPTSPALPLAFISAGCVSRAVVVRSRLDPLTAFISIVLTRLAEGSWDEVMRLIGQAHTLVHQNGVVRVQTDIRAGTRWDKISGSPIENSGWSPSTERTRSSISQRKWAKSRAFLLEIGREKSHDLMLRLPLSATYIAPNSAYFKSLNSSRYYWFTLLLLHLWVNLAS